MRLKLFVSTLLAGALFSSAQANMGAKLDAGIPEYEVKSGVSGNLSSVGSDTLANMMVLWAEDFKKFYPIVNTQVQSAGSSTAPPALAEGASQLAPMSRPMKPKEIEMFERRYGYKPTRFVVAIDALAVYVNQDNPIEGLTIPEVDAIFSSTRKCGAREDVRTWGDLGLSGEWANKSLQLYGRNAVSGTYGYFKTTALCEGDFKSSVNEQPGSASVVQSVSASKNGIGYSGIGYKTASVKALPISKRKGAPYVVPNVRTALTGKYPLTRYMYIYVNKQPGKPLDPMTYEFMKMVLSKQGQEVVIKDGYIPLPKRVLDRELKRLDEL